MEATDSDKDRYIDMLFQSSIQLMHAALRTCEENLNQFKLRFDRLPTYEKTFPLLSVLLFCVF
jgi:hypothetical protein